MLFEIDPERAIPFEDVHIDYPAFGGRVRQWHNGADYITRQVAVRLTALRQMRFLCVSAYAGTAGVDRV